MSHEECECGNEDYYDNVARTEMNVHERQNRPMFHPSEGTSLLDFLESGVVEEYYDRDSDDEESSTNSDD